MENESLTIQLHRSGDFLQNKYSSGLHEIFVEDPDKFSYSVLMEFVKDLEYDEIGGVYVTKGKNGGWKLVSDDKTVGEYVEGKNEVDFYIDSTVDKTLPAMKQMQPHVIVRPRPSPLKAKERNVEKRTFVTLKNINAEKSRKLKDMNDERERKLKDLNEEKERRISIQKKLQFSKEDASPPRREETMCLSDNLKKFEITNMEKKAGANSKKNIEGKGCNEYELMRNKTVTENEAKLEALGLVRRKSTRNCQKDKDKGKVSDDDASESEYIRNNDDAEHERQGDDEDDYATSKRTKKVKKQRVEISVGPRTRSRANNLVDTSEKQQAVVGATSVPVEVNKAPVVSLKENLRHLRDGPGSMTSYLELREREKLQLSAAGV